MRLRGFEVLTDYSHAGINPPVRKTEYSAGYDIETAQDILLPSGQVTLVPTGLKAYMQKDEYLGIHIRSGLAVKHQLSLINNQGIVDADYYNNPENEGHILIPVVNWGKREIELNKGTRIAQGIFYKYLLADQANQDRAAVLQKRTGGFGSTGA
jgi:dUTP pyrophosphatase